MSLMFIEDVIIFSGHTSIWLFYVYFKNFIFTKIKLTRTVFGLLQNFYGPYVLKKIWGRSMVPLLRDHTPYWKKKNI